MQIVHCCMHFPQNSMGTAPKPLLSQDDMALFQKTPEPYVGELSPGLLSRPESHVTELSMPSASGQHLSTG